MKAIKLLKKHEQTIRQKFHVKKIGIFGSFARNEENEASDIDILESVNNIFTYTGDLSYENLIKQFRQFGSKTSGHPEYGYTHGVESTTGPLGQGFANGVGLALAARLMAERFNTGDAKIIDHYIYGVVSDGEMMEGITSEAASFAWHLGLANIIYIY